MDDEKLAFEEPPAPPPERQRAAFWLTIEDLGDYRAIDVNNVRGPADLVAATTKAAPEWTAKSPSASSPPTSSTSIASWKSRHPRKSSRPLSGLTNPAGHPGRTVIPAGLALMDQLITIPQSSILRRPVARRANVGLPNLDHNSAAYTSFDDTSASLHDP